MAKQPENHQLDTSQKRSPLDIYPLAHVEINPLARLSAWVTMAEVVLSRDLPAPLAQLRPKRLNICRRSTDI